MNKIKNWILSNIHKIDWFGVSMLVITFVLLSLILFSYGRTGIQDYLGSFGEGF